MRKDEQSPEKPAETSFKFIQKISSELALIEAEPKSGRFHQIRRHLLLSGHPIVGDYRYAGIEFCDQLGAQLGTGSRMLLQAKSLSLTHPATGKRLLIEAELDPAIHHLANHQI